MTGRTTTFEIPTHQGDLLRQLARTTGKPAGSILAGLIDKACLASGMDVSSDAVRVEPWNGGFIADFFGGAYRIERSRAGLEALAHDLTTIANKGGSVLNLDHGHAVRRRGSGVILTIDALAKKPGEVAREAVELKKSMSPDAARQLAADLRAGLPA